jgi:hypothetical protein
MTAEPFRVNRLHPLEGPPPQPMRLIRIEGEPVSNWLRAALIRATRTAAQTAIGVIGAAAVLADINWTVVASASALAALLSVLTALAGLPEAEEVTL